MRTTFLLLSLLFASSLHAGGINTFSLQPAAPQPGEAVTLRVDSSDGCYSAESSTVTTNGNAIDIAFVMADFACQLPLWATPRIFPLGSFAPGQYTVAVRECPVPPLPCTLRQTLGFTVAGQASGAGTFSIPSLSWVGLACLTLVLCLGAFVGIRR